MCNRPEIDEIDVCILKALLKDSRTSFAEIAKNQQVSTNTIRTHFNQMKKAGIITGSTIHPNPKCLGYEGIAFLAINANVNEENNVLEHLQNIPNIVLSHAQIGKHNIVSILVIKNVDELTKTLELVRNNPHVNTADAAISTDSSYIHHPENLVIEPYTETADTTKAFAYDTKNKAPCNLSNITSEPTNENIINQTFELDKIDQALIRILGKNARESFRRIAKKLGISTKTAIKRYNKLYKDVIPHSSIQINLNKLGYVCNAIFCLNVTKQSNIKVIMNEIARIPNVILATKCGGGIQILAIAPFSNFMQLLKLREEFAKIPGIKQIEILLEETYSDWPQNMFSKLL